MGVKERLKEYIQSKSLTISGFEQSIGASNGYVNNISKGIGKKKLEIILENYSDLSMEWLLTGKGQMLKYSDKMPNPISTDKEPDAIWVNYERFKLVPLVTHRAQAGFLAGWGDEEYMEELPKVPWEVDKEYKGRYVTFEVAGDSMESDTNPRESIFEGDLLLCREVQRTHWKNKLHIHKWDFVIVHREQGILVKRIKEHITGNGTLVLHSLNPYYDDFNVEMDDLIAIFNIVDIKRSARR